ncbi:IclR family transcriptional regulator [Bosea sp. (in: a-proteobacteria)]|nr:IclR family transcriptional regulator [Bosea sp. (in: a-proteobacteria)]
MVIDRPEKQERSENAVRAGETTLLVLETVAFADEPMGVTQIANRLGIAKSAIHRHLQGLTERGYLTQNQSTARYTLGPKAYLIGRLAPGIEDVAAAADGPMREARDKVGLTTVLTAPSMSGMVVLKTVHGTTAIAIGARPGSELPMHASAQGFVTLAFGPALHLERTLRQPLVPLTAHTITEPETLKAIVETVRRDGYATAPEQALLGINALAAPVFNAAGELVAAAAIVSSIQFVPAEPDAGMIAAVVEMARQISRNLGHGYAGPRPAH